MHAVLHPSIFCHYLRPGHRGRSSDVHLWSQLNIRRKPWCKEAAALSSLLMAELVSLSLRMMPAPWLRQLILTACIHLCPSVEVLQVNYRLYIKKAGYYIGTHQSEPSSYRVVVEQRHSLSPGRTPTQLHSARVHEYPHTHLVATLEKERVLPLSRSLVPDPELCIDSLTILLPLHFLHCVLLLADNAPDNKAFSTANPCDSFELSDRTPDASLSGQAWFLFCARCCGTDSCGVCELLLVWLLSQGQYETPETLLRATTPDSINPWVTGTHKLLHHMNVFVGLYLQLEYFKS